jgi:Xaa-Pro aminopeptidase
MSKIDPAFFCHFLKMRAKESGVWLSNQAIDGLLAKDFSMPSTSQPWTNTNLVQAHQQQLLNYFAQNLSIPISSHSGTKAPSRGIDLLFVSAQDSFLSEYTPPENNLRTWLSGFTGSTGDGLFLAHPVLRANTPAPFFLCVDGRYHLQADIECRPNLVEVSKVTQAADGEASIKTKIEVCAQAIFQSEHRKLILAFDARRTSYAFSQTLKKWSVEVGFELHAFLENEPSLAAGLPGWVTTKPLKSISEKVLGRSPKSLNKVITNSLQLNTEFSEINPGDNPCVATTASDDAAFLLCARGKAPLCRVFAP